jgi:hypothetical protein
MNFVAGKILNNIARSISLGGLAFVVGCSAASTSSSVAGVCSKAGKSSVKNSKPAVSAASGLNLSSDGSELTSAQPAVGIGFIDIKTTNASNKALSKRCTFSLRPLGQADDTARIWTAGHCFYDPQTAEFRNSQYTLSVFLDGGYFTLPLTIDGFKEFAALSKYLDGLLNNPLFPLPDNFRGMIASALPRATSEVCESEDKTYRAELGSKAKNIACFSRNELRGLVVRFAPDSKTGPLLSKVLGVLRQREEAVMSKLPAEKKRLFEAYVTSHSWEQRRISDLRSISYLLNSQFCSAAADDRPAPEDPSAAADSAAACAFRSLLIGEFKKLLPASDFSVVSDIFEDSTTPLAELRKKSIGCSRVVDGDYVSADVDLTKMTPCDMNDLSLQTWRTFIDKGPRIPAELGSNAVFGLNKETYYGFYTNVIPTAASGGAAKAVLFPLNSKTVLNFEYLTRLDERAKKNSDTFLINYDAKLQQINPVKGASGSIVSAYGVIPMGLLSTVDGEATSGGASITPLPQVGSEDSVQEPVSQSPNNSGC